MIRSDLNIMMSQHLRELLNAAEVCLANDATTFQMRYRVKNQSETVRIALASFKDALERGTDMEWAEYRREYYRHNQYRWRGKGSLKVGHSVLHLFESGVERIEWIQAWIKDHSERVMASPEGDSLDEIQKLSSKPPASAVIVFALVYVIKDCQTEKQKEGEP